MFESKLQSKSCSKPFPSWVVIFLNEIQTEFRTMLKVKFETEFVTCVQISFEKQYIKFQNINLPSQPNPNGTQNKLILNIVLKLHLWSNQISKTVCKPNSSETPNKKDPFHTKVQPTLRTKLTQNKLKCILEPHTKENTEKIKWSVKPSFVQNWMQNYIERHNKTNVKFSTHSFRNSTSNPEPFANYSSKAISNRTINQTEIKHLNNPTNIESEFECNINLSSNHIPMRV